MTKQVVLEFAVDKKVTSAFLQVPCDSSDQRSKINKLGKG